MYREINSKEQQWLKKIFECEFKGKHILEKQLLKAKAISEEGYDFISLKFKTDETEKYPYSVRVPVEMRVFDNNSAPKVFLLHIIGGFIDELEVITADSSKMDSENIAFDEVKYVIDESVRWPKAFLHNRL